MKQHFNNEVDDLHMKEPDSVHGTCHDAMTLSGSTGHGVLLR